ncbi:MAG: hypothetical protein C0596_00295 [Marinilabiliales bacterium]|nr:MAG: hypothetical protein C0596_00295 [Marinilabiliales bacterium]
MDIYKMEFGTFMQEKFGFHPGLTVIQGQVTDENYDEVSTKISISNDLKDCYNQKVDTDLEGYFSVAVKTGTKYTIEIKESAYEKYSLTLDLTDSSRSRVNFDIELQTKE